MDDRHFVFRCPPFKPLELPQLAVSITLIAPDNWLNGEDFPSNGIPEKKALRFIMCLAKHGEIIEKVCWMVIYPGIIVQTKSRERNTPHVMVATNMKPGVTVEKKLEVTIGHHLIAIPKMGGGRSILVSPRRSIARAWNYGIQTNFLPKRFCWQPGQPDAEI